MAQVPKKHTFSAGNTILSAQVNEDFDDIYNEFNGNITDANVSGSAAIADTKLAQIATAGKVAANTALTGLIPSASQDSILALTDAASIATDAAAATIFTVTLGGNRTLANPTNSVAGMKRMWRFTQDGTGNRTITLDTDFRVSETIDNGSIILSIQAGAVDYMGAIYDGTYWDVIAFTRRML